MEKLQKAMNEGVIKLEPCEKPERTEADKRLQDIFNLGFQNGLEAGVKQMMDKIQKHYELGKPVMANGELYFFKDARQNLIDIMDDIDAEHGIEKEKKYIVPISITYSENHKVTREVIIQTNRPETAMLIAIGDFQHNGWLVDTNFNNYKIME